jgi:hypothetical protein
VQHLLQTKKSLLSLWKHEKRLGEEEGDGVSSMQETLRAEESDDLQRQEKRRLETKKKLMSWQKQKEDELREGEVGRLV